MASFEMAFEYVMRHEDPQILGNVVREPKSGVARFGINSIAHPEAVRDGFYSMSKEAALWYASSVYQRSYFNPVGGRQIADQTIANKFFDLAVNEGVFEATKIVQRAVNVVRPGLPLTVDGRPGPHTIDAINQSLPGALLVAIRNYGQQFYEDIARRDPALAPCLDEWLRRLNS